MLSAITRAALGSTYASYASLSALAVACTPASAPPAAPAAVETAPATTSSAGASGGAPPAVAAAAVAVPVGGSAESAASTTSSVATHAAPGEPGKPAPQRAADDADDSCHVTVELARAYQKFGKGERRRQWIANARVKVLSADDAERALTGISQEILSAIAHKRYEKLAAFAGKDGICLRAAKGAECRVLSTRDLAGCSASRVRSDWRTGPADGDTAKFSCGEAFRRIFYARDYLHVGKPRFNCFDEAGSGDAASIMASPPRLGYVQLYSEGPGGARSLWLVFDGDPRAPELVEMINDGSAT